MATKTQKLPWMKFFPADWSKDPALTLCAPATRGIWIDLICAMHNQDQSGELRGTADQLARFTRCTTVEFVQAMTDLRTNRAADVAERNGLYEICNRRMKSAYISRKSNADRVQRHRSKKRNGECNADDALQKSEVRIQKTNPHPPRNGESILNPADDPWAAVAGELFSEGVQIADEATAAAEQRGCLPSEALEVIRQWRDWRPAYGVGLLVSKIRALQPGAKISWPEPPPGCKRASQRKLDSDTTKILRTEAAEFEIQQKREAEEMSQLESAYGQVLDGMPKAKQRKLCLSVCPVLVGWIPARGKIESPLLRRQLLKWLEMDGGEK